MAETNGAQAPSTDEQDERRPTERVILKRVCVIVVPESIEPEQIAAAVENLYPKAKRGDRERAVADGWVEVARKTGASKRAAIVAHTGEPGTPDAEVGEFRAPSSTAWKGGLRLVAPPEPLVEAEAIE